MESQNKLRSELLDERSSAYAQDIKELDDAIKSFVLLIITAIATALFFS